MPASATETGFYRVSLALPCPTAELALPTLEKHLGVSRQELSDRISRPGAVLCDSLAAPMARHLSTLLAGLGVALRMEPAESVTAAGSCVDISVQPIDSEAITGAAQALAMLLPLKYLPDAGRDPAATEAALAGPGGLILTSVPEQSAARLRSRMRRIPGIVTSISAPLTALYDLLPDYRAGLTLPVGLLTGIRRLGLRPCRLTGAIAARLNQRTCDLLLTRYPQVPLIALNRDFQRFDLFLTGAGRLSRNDLADFLTRRTDLPRSLLEHIPRKLKIESGLSRSNALAFQADYAALGLETVARLRVFHRLGFPADDRKGPMPDALLPHR